MAYELFTANYLNVRKKPYVILDRPLAPPVALDDRDLERLLPQLGYLQPYLTGLGLQIAVMTEMTFPSGLGVFSVMATPSCCTGCV